VSIEAIPFEKIFRSAGQSTLIDLTIGDAKPVKVLIQDTQINPLTDKIIHVDFRQVKMSEKINAEILLKFIGDAKAVKELGGMLVKNMDKIKVKCLPDSLVHEIEVDISSLDTFEKTIYVRDLKVPAAIEVLEHANEPVVNVAPPRSEEELKSLEEKVEMKVEDVKVETEEKKKEKA
jgi:large subunit ribosomal protein L25